MQPEQLFPIMKYWLDCGWLQPLDIAFAKFLNEQSPKSSYLVYLAAALTSNQLGKGHICLEIDMVLSRPEKFLSISSFNNTKNIRENRLEFLINEVDLELWEKNIQESDLISNGNGCTPLVYSDGRLYLRKYWQYEENVSSTILQKLENKIIVNGDISKRLDLLFSHLRTSQEKNRTQIHWQSVAAVIAAKSSFCIISGGPGTGKTTTVVQILALLQKMALEEGHALNINLAAPTGKAAARLTSSVSRSVKLLSSDLKKHIPTEAITLHRLLGSRINSRQFKYNLKNKLFTDLLVIDEASMVDLEMMNAICEALPDKARLLMLGDKDQLSSVEAGSVFGDLCQGAEKSVYNQETLDYILNSSGYDLQEFAGNSVELDQNIVLLRKSHRFDDQSGIGNLAKAIRAGDKDGSIDVLSQKKSDISVIPMQTLEDFRFTNLVLKGESDTSQIVNSETADVVGYQTYLETVSKGPSKYHSQKDWFLKVINDFNKFQILTPLQQGVWGVEALNDRITAILVDCGMIKPKNDWYSGRPVLVTKNDYTLGLMNGDIGIAMPSSIEESATRQDLKVIFPSAEGEYKSIFPYRLKDVQTVFAMTVHKSQGSEFDHTALVLPDYMSSIVTRELLYTGVTRARKKITIVCPEMEVFEHAVQQITQRSSGLTKQLR